MCLVLGKDATESMCWWIDASYAVHPNMHGHTGETMSMRNGSIYSGSWKQKMVTRSSTESEVVGVYDILPQILWTKKFLEDQGLTIKETVFYQDNMSSMLLEHNGQQSSTKHTKHMDIRYIYVSDHIRNKTLSLKHCPTEEMLADDFTKPFQGALFAHLHNHIMGAEFASGDSQTHRSVLNDDDHDTQMEASEREQNNEDVCDVSISACEQNNENVRWDQNNENVRRDQNNENVRDGSQTQDQNNENTLGANPHFGGKTGKQMTYREALIGLAIILSQAQTFRFT